MLEAPVLALSLERNTRRQIARALFAGGLGVQFATDPATLTQHPAALLILDADAFSPDALTHSLQERFATQGQTPVVLVAQTVDGTSFLGLLQHADIDNVIAKHGTSKDAHRPLDEHELLVTCHKILGQDIFGIEKYLGAWGIEIHTSVLSAVADKASFLLAFDEYLRALDCPPVLVPEVLTVADELILNAMVHAPRDPHGAPKYESTGPVAGLVLTPREHVTVRYGCDGRHLMVSISDNFGMLEKATVRRYLGRLLDSQMLTAEAKASGAGLGLSISFQSVHQLIYNVQPAVRTEVIAGWNLRTTSVARFRAEQKSLNFFWLSPGT